MARIGKKINMWSGAASGKRTPAQARRHSKKMRKSGGAYGGSLGGPMNLFTGSTKHGGSWKKGGPTPKRKKKR